MEITKREIIASISIIAIMLLIGFLISSKISESQMDKNEVYNKAVKIQEQDLFQHGMDTNVGNAFIYGELKTVDPVTYPEIDGQYMYVKKAKERYTRHTRTVTKTRMVNGKSQAYTQTEVYWTWDVINTESKHSKLVTFLGIEFEYGEIYIPEESQIDTQKESSNIRYVYYGSPTTCMGTAFASLKDGKLKDAQFYESKSIEETINYLESEVGIILFWIIWVIIICGSVFAFYYFDNKWLE